jgi:hypothetical protein
MGASSWGALWSQGRQQDQTSSSVTISPQGWEYQGYIFPANTVDLRIPSPDVFNLTVWVFANRDASDFLVGEPRAPILKERLAGPSTLHLSLDHRNAYLVAFQNHDNHTLSVSFGTRVVIGQDQELMRISAWGALAGGIVLTAGWIVLARSRRHAQRS